MLCLIGVATRWFRDPTVAVPLNEITRFPHAVLEVCEYVTLQRQSRLCLCLWLCLCLCLCLFESSSRVGFNLVIVTSSLNPYHTAPTPHHTTQHTITHHYTPHTTHHTTHHHTQVKLQLLGEGATPHWVTDLINSGNHFSLSLHLVILFFTFFHPVC